MSAPKRSPAPAPAPSLLLLLPAALLLAAPARAQPWPYQNISLPFWDRAADLVGRLTLTQQVELLLAQDAQTGGVPEFDINDYNWWTECNSGIGVEYPQNVNMAATFNRTLAFLAGRGTGVGLRKAADAEVQDISCWSPMMNVARHPMWGRAHEGYGEDPLLAGEMGFQNVLGIQGFGLEGYPRYSLANTGCKHFSAFNGPENWGTADINDYGALYMRAPSQPPTPLGARVQPPLTSSTSPLIIQIGSSTICRNLSAALRRARTARCAPTPRCRAALAARTTARCRRSSAIPGATMASS